MSVGPFAHLHCHTHYSLLDGANRVPDLIKQVKKLGMNSCAITDHGNLYGALEFYQVCKKEGVNPILGYEAYMAPGHRTDRSASRLKEAAFHLTLLAMNRTGFQNLVKLGSKAFLEGFYYKPRIDKEILEAHSEGIICLSGCASSELSRLLLAEESDKARQLIDWYTKVFGDRFYLEIQDGGVEIQQSCAEATIAVANRMGLPLVATNDAHYLCQDDADMHDVLLCVNTKSFRSDEKRMKIGTDQLFLRSPEQMYAAFPKLAEAVARSQEIADRCDIDLDLKTRHFPVFTPPPEKTDVQYLREVAYEGLKWRYGENPEQKFVDRLEFELGVIERMGFASYFLIVWDFARFARDKGIPCTARGSACGAICSYVLGISDICPIEYDLLFERFLDPSRSEAPDIDMDFCRDRREWVINYVKEKYGHENVAQIGTFGTLKAKAAIRDVARALSIPLKRADEIAKMVPETLNIKLKDALKESAELKEAYDGDPQVKELITFAIALEGLAKSAGTHAAGVVIADRPLQEYIPLQRITGKEDVLTQWTEVEKAGLLKMDFLGLRNLSILDKAVINVRKHRGLEIVPKDLPLDDQETFALLQRGETKGIFQLESGGMRDLLTKMKPDKFADIIATSALYRPGPLEGGMVMTYVNVKHGREPAPTVHPIVDNVLAETYGVMVYQEQVMRILNRLGGIELASSYKCIKAISKKNHEIMGAYHEQFIAGAQTHGMAAEQAQEIWDLIAKFAGYGFNKSHSTAYGAIAYQTAYLKAHFPEEFMAALLSCGMESSERIFEHTDDARRMGIEILPPDVNTSEVEFGVVVVESSVESPVSSARKGDKRKSAAQPDSSSSTLNPQPSTIRKISFGLGAIKGVGLAAMQAIVDERIARGPYKDIFDLCERVDPKLLSKGAMEALVKAGGLDRFGPSRPQHMLVIDRAVQGAAARQRDKARGQRSLFGEPTATGPGEDTQAPIAVPPAENWTHSQQLAYEKEVFGFYLTSHPLTEFADQIEGFTQHTTADLRNLGDGKEVLLGGMISSIKKATTKNPSRNGNSKYVNFDLEDPSGVVRCIMWPDQFAVEGEKVKADSIMLIKGRIDARGREPNVIVNKLMTIADAEKEFTKQVAILLKRGFHSEEDMKRVRDILGRYPGKTPVVVVVDTLEASPANGNGSAPNGENAEEGSETQSRRLRAFVATPLQVSARAELKQELYAVLGEKGFRFQSIPPSNGSHSAN
ncbi:DNA polymerase III subunit alpha [Planctomicrobium piriforme]|uniref:DNA polymerase III subunit alpha n=1 Tax=Planctomicrobium piriforme TaxID=1576369 RepID=A0A1I3DE84_9PLAN|nr:DNA polymerase III subunit alpha [Planctomicrobium piriforme]SFH85054.1 DNA polymerase-3 subunit alpha [Planctomicrobium piriforme]